jgi:hypothetical protein
MLKDRYDNPLSTGSATAQGHYIEGVDRVLSGAGQMAAPFHAALEADPAFAIAYCGLARALVLSGDMPAAKAAMANATELNVGLPSREGAHIHTMGLLFAGKANEAYQSVLSHVADYPRDAMIAQLATSIFGLIGFSGQPGREAELVAYTAGLLPHYGEDWWMLSQHAFSLCETGQLTAASKMIDRSMAIKDDNSHGAHVRSHVYYEEGNLTDGIAYLEGWLPQYDRAGLMHGHLSWHVALWALEQGDVARMWRRVDSDVQPNAAQGLPINILTDTASILYRAEMVGEAVSPERWKKISDYAAQSFPKLGNSFIDIHAALAHAMAGRVDLLDRYVSDAKGPAADLVAPCAGAYAAMVKEDWAAATALLSKAMVDDARLGGSRAQRDMLELSLVNALLRQGKGEEAKRILGLRRPVLAKSMH